MSFGLHVAVCALLLGLLLWLGAGTRRLGLPLTPVAWLALALAVAMNPRLDNCDATAYFALAFAWLSCAVPKAQNSFRNRLLAALLIVNALAVPVAWIPAEQVRQTAGIFAMGYSILAILALEVQRWRHTASVFRQADRTRPASP